MAVLFDLDGTLLDTAPDFYRAAEKLLAEEALSQTYPGHTKLRPMISHGSRHIIRQLFNIDESHCDHPRLFQRFIDLYQAENYAGTQPFPGIINLLDALEQQHIPWGIVTNKPEYLTFPLLEMLDLHPRPGTVVCGDTTAHSKPHPEPLFHACRALDVDPTTCIYVGDAERDMIAGQKAGMTTIAALFGYVPDMQTAKTWPAHHYVDTVEDIHPICIEQFNLAKP